MINSRINFESQMTPDKNKIIPIINDVQCMQTSNRISGNYIYNYISSFMKKRFSKEPPESEKIDAEPKPTKQQIIRRKLGSVEENIINQLEQCQLTIPRTKVPFLNEKQKQTAQELAYERFLHEKKKMQEKIKELENTEKIYMGKSRIIDKSKVPSPISKVQITEEDKQNLKHLKKKLKEFQKSIEKKTIQIEQEKLRLKKQQQIRLAEERSAANEAKKAKIQQRLEEIRQRNLQRQAEKKAQDNALKKIEQKKKLYELLDESWKEKNNLEQQRKHELMEIKIRQKRVNFAELREHEKKYEEIISQKKRELMQKRLSSSRQSPNSSFSAQKSKFLTVVLKEQKKAKDIEQLKKQRPKLIHQKRLQYAEFVRQQFVPKPKHVSDDETTKEKEQPKIIKLSKQEIKQMGNSNLRKGNKLVKKKQNLNITAPTKQEDRNKSGVQSSASHYHDYLKQVRLKKEQENYYNGFYNSPKMEAQRIMKDDKIKKEDKIAKIKLLADRFDTKSTDLVSKIQGKIQILEVIN